MSRPRPMHADYIAAATSMTPSLQVPQTIHGLDQPSLVNWGVELGRRLPRPAVIALHGELGAGKTTLARGICEGLGVTDLGIVTSPTFSLIQEYEGREAERIVHVDLYRLKNSNELEQLGWEELVATAPVLIIEWPDRALDSLPADSIHIRITHDEQDSELRLLELFRQP